MNSWIHEFAKSWIHVLDLTVQDGSLTDGTKAIELTGQEFIDKLVAIIPQPRIHMTRFHWIFAPHSKYRSKIVPKQQVVTAESYLHEPKEEKLNAFMGSVIKARV